MTNNVTETLQHTIARQVYCLMMWLAQPLLRRKLARRGRQEPGYLLAIDERFGHYGSEAPPDDGRTVWVHAVSLGETRAAAVLVAALRAQLPGIRLLLTHGTATGRAEGARLLQPGDLQAWQPWDTPAAAQRFLAHFRPRIGILMETEIWPNLVQGCRQHAIPLVLINARLSDKSLRQSQRMVWLAKPAFAALSAVWAQTSADAERLVQLGAPVRGVLGNLKFDAAPDADQLETGRAWRARLNRPVVMFASSREGEELALLQILSAAKHHGDVQWLIVPRHPQRFGEVAALIEEHGFAVLRRSSWGDGGPQSSAQPAIWLGDSLGEMALYYGLADVALLGGSFEPLGGQNLIEAAACGCPVVTGPHTFNFAEAAEQALAAGAAQRVADMAEAVVVACDLAADRQRRQFACGAASAFSQQHRGAVQRTVEAIEQVLAEIDEHQKNHR